MKFIFQSFLHSNFYSFWDKVLVLRFWFLMPVFLHQVREHISQLFSSLQQASLLFVNEVRFKINFYLKIEQPDWCFLLFSQENEENTLGDLGGNIGRHVRTGDYSAAVFERDSRGTGVQMHHLPVRYDVAQVRCGLFIP